MRYFILLLFFTPFLSVTQTNLFDSIGSKWYTTEGYYITGPDIEINSMTYKEFFRCDAPDFANQYYVGAIRYEAFSSQVFFFPLNNTDTSELLLYDFDVNLQDTVTIYSSFSSYEPVRVRVNSISTITIGSHQFQKIGVVGIDQSSGFTESWQFGTGSNFGPLNPGLSGLLIFDITYPRLICSELDTVYYHDPDFRTCANDLSVAAAKANSLSVYAKDKQIVVEGLSAADLQKAVFVTLSGTTFPVGNIISTDNSGFRFDIPETASGLLFVQLLTTRNEFISSKVFITR